MWDWSYRIVGMAFGLHTVDLGSIPVIPYGPLSTACKRYLSTEPGVIPEHCWVFPPPPIKVLVIKAHWAFIASQISSIQLSLSLFHSYSLNENFSSFSVAREGVSFGWDLTNKPAEFIEINFVPLQSSLHCPLPIMLLPDLSHQPCLKCDENLKLQQQLLL